MKDAVLPLLEQVYGQPIGILQAIPQSGGSINHALRLDLENGESVFLKHHPNPPGDFFRKEAAGLRLLAGAAQGFRVPEPLALDTHHLLLEFIEEIPAGRPFYPAFARALARLHRTTQAHHGLDHDNYIGEIPQINTQEKDGLVFFRDHRLGYQQRLARESGKIPIALDRKIDRLRDRLIDHLGPVAEPPALLHGDLWSGNYFATTGQTPCIFDPAVYFGAREADLAMTELFGRLPQAFYDAYNEAYPLLPGYEERKPLYNLYHLLNHLNLFGGSYLASVASVVDAYTR